MPSSREIVILLKSQTKESGDCWEWQAGKFTVGYGCCPAKFGDRYAHRAMFASAVGPIPQGMYVLHVCDNRLCINPAHLFLGTHIDNIKDMHAKNRQRGGSLPGETNPSCVYPDAVISQILKAHANGVQKREIEKSFGISETHYYRVIKRQSRIGA